MRVILLRTVRNFGRAGDVIGVKGGFGRHLVQCKDAMYSTPANLQELQRKQEELKEVNLRFVSEAVRVAEILSESVLTFVCNAGDSGKLFGSITKKEIAKNLNEIVQATSKEVTFVVDHSHVLLKESLKAIGVSKVKISLHQDIDDIFVVSNVARSVESAKLAIDKFIEEQKSTDTPDSVQY